MFDIILRYTKYLGPRFLLFILKVGHSNIQSVLFPEFLLLCLLLGLINLSQVGAIKD